MEHTVVDVVDYLPEGQDYVFMSGFNTVLISDRLDYNDRIRVICEIAAEWQARTGKLAVVA